MKLNFSRPGRARGVISSVTILVNDREVGKIRNNSDLIIDIPLSGNGKTIVQARSGISKKKVEIEEIPGAVYQFETSFMTMASFSLYLRLKSVVNPEGDMVSGAGKSLVNPGKANLNKRTLALSYQYVTTNDSDSIRMFWAQNGGKITGNSVAGAGTFTSMKTDEMKMTGYGGNLIFTSNNYNLTVPEFKPGITTWNSFVYGGSTTISITNANTIVEAPPLEPMEFSSSSMVIIMSGNGGYTLGLGKFKSEKVWKGAALELTYRPSVVMTVANSDVQFDLNYTGFGFDVNFTSFTSAARRLAPKANSKFTFFMLPPINDMPLVITAGYGVVWYNKR